MTWNGLAADYANPVSASEQNCQDGVNCDTFKLTVSGTQADWAGKTVHIQIDWLSPTFDYALSVHKVPMPIRRLPPQTIPLTHHVTGKLLT